jgi:hypothetical protein
MNKTMSIENITSAYNVAKEYENQEEADKK